MICIAIHQHHFLKQHLTFVWKRELVLIEHLFAYILIRLKKKIKCFEYIFYMCVYVYTALNVFVFLWMPQCNLLMSNYVGQVLLLE